MQVTSAAAARVVGYLSAASEAALLTLAGAGCADALVAYLEGAAAPDRAAVLPCTAALGAAAPLALCALHVGGVAQALAPNASEDLLGHDDVACMLDRWSHLRPPQPAPDHTREYAKFALLQFDWLEP